MPKKKDVTGVKFNRLFCLDNGTPKVMCICDCGVTKSVNRNHLISGNIISCGCYQKEVMTQVNPPTLASSNQRLYSIWSNMMSRCNNPNVDCYPRYGGRGISVDILWSTFDGFFYNLPEGYSDNLELDRIDNNGNYTLPNCRWSDRSVQCFNKNTKYKGITYCERDNLYRAKIVKDGKTYQKYFKLEQDACVWRQAKELELYGFNTK